MAVLSFNCFVYILALPLVCLLWTLAICIFQAFVVFLASNLRAVLRGELVSFFTFRYLLQHNDKNPLFSMRCRYMDINWAIMNRQELVCCHQQKPGRKCTTTGCTLGVPKWEVIHESKTRISCNTNTFTNFIVHKRGEKSPV